MWPFDTSAWYLRPVSVLEECKDFEQQRHEACDFIAKVARRLNFPYRTIASAQLYFHLFFSLHPHTDYPSMDIALTTLLVASKAEETFQRIQQILVAAYRTLNPQAEGKVRIIEEHRVRVTQYEHLVLEAIDYNFAVRHAHEVLARIGAELDLTSESMSSAFRFCKDCYYTPIVLCYPPEFIAAAAIIWMRTAEGSKTEEMRVLEKLVGSSQEKILKIIDFVKQSNKAM
ncbi:hypothetical protein PSACC_02093 [Paramicrosporidium saccamoebae]|uniref:Cyclin-like domain-containing protein n=1 Tax=Paramicrosporidium saccamoebae TaxID=1246581 RepID=A0A2H9TK34_9FUNG|nr:hypothetical protein PSACC_02093 [Paramicrosporidium saccamoebae]